MRLICIRIVTVILLSILLHVINVNSITLASDADSDTTQAANKKPVDYELCKIQSIDHKTWLDKAHAYLNTKFCEPAIWFDSFFATDRTDEENRAGTTIRWRNDFRLIESQGFEFKTRFNASVQLPKTTRKLKIVFESDERDDLEDIAPSTGEEVQDRLGLRYEFVKSANSNLNVRVNLRPSVTLRYRFTYPFSDRSLTRITQEIFRRKSVNGARTRLDFEKSFDLTNLLRWTNEATVKEDIDGAELITGLVFFQQVNDISALSYEASIRGITEPNTYASNYRLGLRYRLNFYRDWLFADLVPEVNFPKIRDEVSNTLLERKTELAFMFRLEMFFDNL